MDSVDILQLLKHGKAYKKKGYVNYCPNCKTVLSNEDSQGGLCDRCGGAVVQEERWVWFLKMKEYSEKLLGNVDRITMREHLKEAQRNWIGRSEGVEVSFELYDANGDKLNNVKIFTTCIETIYGVTFMVLAPEHELVESIKDHIKNYDEVTEYKKRQLLEQSLIVWLIKKKRLVASYRVFTQLIQLMAIRLKYILQISYLLTMVQVLLWQFQLMIREITNSHRYLTFL